MIIWLYDFYMIIYIDVNVIVSLEKTQVRKFFTFSIKSYCSVSWEWTLLKPSFICLKETHQFLSRSCRHCFTFSQSFSRPCTGKLQTSLIIPWGGLDIFQILQQLTYETLPKAQRTRGLSSYHKFFKSEPRLSMNFKISTKHQFLV